MPRSSHARSNCRTFATLLVPRLLGGAALSGQSAKSSAAGHVAWAGEATILRADGALEASYLGGDRTEAGSPLILSEVHA